MVETAVTETPAPAPRRRRVLWSVLVVVLVVVVAGVITAVRVTRHYSAAPPLECSCGLGWAPPDNLHSRQTTAGSYSAMNIFADPSRRQAFYVDIENRSSVTQTILGTANGDAEYKPKLEAAAQRAHWLSELQLTYSDGPVSLAPHQSGVLRYSLQIVCLGRGTSLIIDGLDLRVRVGGSTRTKHIDFGETSFVVHGTGSRQNCPIP